MAVSIAALPQQSLGFASIKATTLAKTRTAITPALGEYEKPLGDG